MLVRSPEFAELFLTTIRERLGRAADTQLTNYRGALHVSTQVSYTGEDDGSGEGNDSGGGRFDLVIKPEEGENFIVVLESKVGLDPDIGMQSAEYKERLKSHPQFSQVSKGERYVLTLTPASGTPRGADAHLSWQGVHALLDTFSKPLPGTDPSNPGSSTSLNSCGVLALRRRLCGSPGVRAVRGMRARGEAALNEVTAGRGFPIDHLARDEDAGQTAEHEIVIELAPRDTACG